MSVSELSLERIVHEIEQELQQEPQVRSWRTRIVRTVNEVLEELWSSYDWPWSIQQAPLWVFPDFEFSRADLSFVADSERVFEFSFEDVDGLMWPTPLTAEGETGNSIRRQYLQHLVGAEVGLETVSPTDAQRGNWNEGPFIVDRVTQRDAEQHWMWLDSRLTVTSALESTGASYKVRFPRWQLPYDFDHFVDHAPISDERGVALQYVHPAQYRNMVQGHGRPPREGPGTPRFYTVDEGPDLQVPHDRLNSPEFRGSAALAPSDHNVNHTPSGLTGVVDNSGSSPTLRIGQLHRFAVSWYYRGRHGALSNVVELTPTSSAPSVLLTVGEGLPGNATLDPDVSYGWVLAVWVAVGDGPFVLQSYVDPPPNPVAANTTVRVNHLDDVNTYSSIGRRPWAKIRHDVVYANPYRYIKLHPRPTAFRRYDLRYHRRPVPLLAPEDTPPFDRKFHRYLVYEAASRLAVNNAAAGGTPALATPERLRRMAAAVLSRMVGQYLGDHVARKQKGMLTATDRGRYPLEAPVDYNGDW